MRRPNTATAYVLTCIVGLWACGCGGGPPQAATVERQFFTIRDQGGRERVAPAEELFGESRSPAGAVQILAIDRETGAETWVTLAELGREAPALARYVPRPRTKAEAGASNSAAQ